MASPRVIRSANKRKSRKQAPTLDKVRTLLLYKRTLTWLTNGTIFANIDFVNSNWRLHIRTRWHTYITFPFGSGLLFKLAACVGFKMNFINQLYPYMSMIFVSQRIWKSRYLLFKVNLSTAKLSILGKATNIKVFNYPQDIETLKLDFLVLSTTSALPTELVSTKY